MMSFFDANPSECRGPCRHPATVPQKIYRSFIQAELRPRNLWSFPLIARAGERAPLGAHRPRDSETTLRVSGGNSSCPLLIIARTQQQVWDAFAALPQSDFYLHGYFIYGNIGETEEEMLYIPKFAKEIKLDSISYQKLRVEKFSPLKEVIEQTPGYHYDRVGGPVYSGRYGLKELRQIRNRIRSEFYDRPQIVHIIRKAGRNLKTDQSPRRQSRRWTLG